MCLPMKSILITGASGGMGRAAVQRFARDGFRVFALDKTPCAAAENIIPITADITDENSVFAAVTTVRTQTDEL